MLATLWHQNAPYNNLCPEEGWNGHSAAGCVAVAMAQIMRHHQYPETVMPAGIPAYTPPRIGQEQAALPAISFDWASMSDSYGSKDDATAVATLIRYCGQAVQMDYASSSSAASDRDAMYAFKHYFGYDEDMRILLPSSYTIAEWDEIIYNELKENRPVMYSGRNTYFGGHEFVVDGYDGAGLYHVNWGWGGGSNGFFSLFLMNPSSYPEGFPHAQTALVGIGKPDGKSLPVIEVPDSGRKLTVNEQRIADISNGALQLWWANESSTAGIYDYGLAEEDAQGQLHLLRSGSTYIDGYSTFSFYDTYDCYDEPLSKLTFGLHKLVPVSRLKGQTEWHRSNRRGEYAQMFVGTEEGGGIFRRLTISYDAPSGLVTSDIQIDGGKSVFSHGDYANVVVKLQTGPNDYVGRLYLNLQYDNYPMFLPDCNGNRYNTLFVTIPAGEQAEAQLHFYPSTIGTFGNVSDRCCGPATLIVSTDGFGQNIIGQKHITVNDVHQINRVAEGVLTRDGSTAIYHLTLENISWVDYNGPLTVELEKAVRFDNKVIQEFSDHITLPARSQQTYSFAFDNLDENTHYKVKASVVPNGLTTEMEEVDTMEFYLSELALITPIYVSVEAEKTIYHVSGWRAAPPLRRGIYIQGGRKVLIK